jgi:hypothetical protein
VCSPEAGGAIRPHCRLNPLCDLDALGRLMNRKQVSKVKGKVWQLFPLNLTPAVVP